MTTPQDHAAGLLDLLLRLAELLAHETSLLTAGRVNDIGPLQREKLRVTGLYQRAVKDLQEGARAADLPIALRTQIIAASARLAQVAVENERALRIGRAATRRLLDMVVESVKARMKPLYRYTAERLAPPPDGARTAFAVDRRM
jgi:hypothetical protein